MIGGNDRVIANAHLSSRKANQKREEYHFGYNLTAVNKRPFSTLHIHNYTAAPVVVTDRTNIPSVILPVKSERGETGIVLDFVREISAYDYESLMNLPNLAHLDQELEKALMLFKDSIELKYSGSKLLSRRYVLPTLSKQTLMNGYFHHESDLLFSDASVSPNNYPLHPRSEMGLLCITNNWAEMLGSVDKANHSLLYAYVDNEKIDKLYRATNNGVQVLQTWYRPEIPSCIISQQPKIYDERNLNAPPDHFEMGDPESFSLEEAASSLNIFANFEEARVAAYKLRNPEIVVDVLKSQSDLTKEQIRAKAVHQELSSMDERYRYENKLAANKGITEVIKTVGLIGAGIGALVGLYKLIR